MKKTAYLNVFMYHRVGPEPAEGSVSLRTFEKQLDYILKFYTVLDLKRLLAYLQGETIGAGPFALLTFDDGWLDNWLYATPLLLDKKIPAVLALGTGFLHDGPLRTGRNDKSLNISFEEGYRMALIDGDKQAFLSEKEVQAMMDTGLWSIQAHGHTHAKKFLRVIPKLGAFPQNDDWSLQYALNGVPPFPGIPCGTLVSDLCCRRQAFKPSLLEQLKESPSAFHEILKREPYPLFHTESEDEFETRIFKDLLHCQNKIKNITGCIPELFFWPWGHYSEVSLKAAARAEFSYTFSVEKGLIYPQDKRFVLPRIGVSEKWKKFCLNGWTFRSAALAKIHSWISPSPSGFIHSTN